jgi:hypothetical protein
LVANSQFQSTPPTVGAKSPTSIAERVRMTSAKTARTSCNGRPYPATADANLRGLI